MLTLADQIRNWVVALGGGVLAAAILKYLTDREKNRQDRATAEDTTGTNNFDKVATHLLAIVTRQDAEMTTLKQEFKAEIAAVKVEAQEEREELEARLKAQAAADSAALTYRITVVEAENATIRGENVALRAENVRLKKDNTDLGDKVRALARQVAGQKNPPLSDPPVSVSDVPGFPGVSDVYPS